MKKTSKKSRKSKSRSQRLSLKAAILLTTVLVILGCIGDWFVHHPRTWHENVNRYWPTFVTAPLYWIGNPVGDITDGLGLTGHDVVYEYDTEAPAGEVTFAGLPVRTGAPAPTDIVVLDRGHFKIGWSNSLRHPVWCAYHVTREALHSAGKRPGFTKDRSVPAAPRPDDYTNGGFDRGHMAPNYAIMTRYGEEAQKKTFMMSNIAPQSAALNRGVWRDVEHRIAELWTARYGEIWVVVGCIPSATHETLSGTNVDVPRQFFQVIMAQDGMDVRALAMIFPQTVPWNAWAARYIVTIDELEEMTGLDFNPDLPSFIQDPLEAELPTRLWPVRFLDVIRQVLIRLG